MEYKEFKAHFTAKHSPELEDYVLNTVMLKSRYLFFSQRKGIQIAHCTHCKKTHVPGTKLKHKQVERVTCPHCKSICYVRASWISRKYMYDQGVFVWYEKSLIDPQAITARVISVYWTYGEDFLYPEKKFSPSWEYLFTQGKSVCFAWGRTQIRVSSAFDREYSYGSWPRFVNIDNIERAVAGTPFQYSTWKTYTRYHGKPLVSDMTEFFDLAARYPCIEYLTKSGFSKFVWAKLMKKHTWGALSWTASTLLKVVRLSKAELKELRELNIEITPKQLRFYQLQRKAGRKFTFAEILILSEFSDSFYEGYYNSAVKLSDEKTVLKYILKQVRNGHYRSASSMLTEWKDYRDECTQLGRNITEERHLFPNNLRKAHTETSKKIKFKRDPVVDQNIVHRLELLNEFRMENEAMFIRPAMSSEELFEEGALQGHCIGSYAKDYSKGETDLFLIRRKVNPDEPFYAMEVKQGCLIQCQGLARIEPTTEVKKLIDIFIAEMNKKIRKTKQTKSKPQGVAV